MKHTPNVDPRTLSDAALWGQRQAVMAEDARIFADGRRTAPSELFVEFDRWRHWREEAYRRWGLARGLVEMPYGHRGIVCPRRLTGGKCSWTRHERGESEDRDACIVPLMDHERLWRGDRGLVLTFEPYATVAQIEAEVRPWAERHGPAMEVQPIGIHYPGSTPLVVLTGRGGTS